jgi:hypothetical protein
MQINKENILTGSNCFKKDFDIEAITSQNSLYKCEASF